jgi:hypothetical protein
VFDRKIHYRLSLLMLSAWVLSGCAAAVVALPAMELGVGGYEVYKVVQTSEGGSVGVSFPQRDGKEIAPAPLPLARRVAVWPNEENEKYLAEKLMASHRFDVTTPGRVRVILANASVSPNIRDLTDQEQVSAFAVVCRKARTDMVLVARDAGSVSRSNALSFSNAAKLTKSDLLVYSCGQRTVVWRDEMTLKIELGDKTPSTAEIAKVGGDAWAGRILQAEAEPKSQVGELTTK